MRFRHEAGIQEEKEKMRIKRAYYKLRYYNILGKVAESTNHGQKEAYYYDPEPPIPQ